MGQVIIKNSAEIELMRQGGKILALVLSALKDAVRPGITTGELNSLAEKLIAEHEAIPSFRNYCPSPGDTPFPTTLCASINEEVVHAPALPSRVLKEGDIICLDLGLKYPSGDDGLFVDAAITVGVGKISEEAERIMKVTEESLWAGIAKVKHGNFIHDISKAVQKTAEKEGFSVVRDLVGHGVGHKVHEAPRIPNFFDSSWKATPLIEGMTICIEPMVCAGGARVKTKDDEWTVVTADGKISAHFEHTILVTKEGYEVLTK
ncbi:type I methionyl aminopeptidase [Candidatus Falkowbacteria bacterium RIFOXYB2_FULL_38_15]|uniref:Methionine aminopeptidase n=1 Tax=Candidatus Falkowbacteria bacterium RIFOXYA2_FULL_38_12 TaxID=1797993 RepID=A0A1F5S2X3_9BACT|nr:MAG: type I methionyl aminopeptidase [Candidatus Falkowbacteria bacterium RIFOXYA2_FULL_38_12]OGF33149.1 MAG: type I methionyl aminopeptidase [Candidatus Falkowbacteria bacterium RIFOXYB2_FULL_38_15]OGF43840.1 MAG: type I methionyl aminopeptidase [Candidatus Falkowbacteria bacterium RIFOXYD2_FULL_39_16]